MQQTKHKSNLEPYIRAGYAAIAVASSEEERISTEICRMAVEMGYECWAWTCSQGMKSSDGKSLEGEADKALPESAEPIMALKKFIEHVMATNAEGAIVPKGKQIRDKSIVIMKDMHMFLRTNNPVLIRMVKDAIHIGRATQRHLIFLGCSGQMPPELEKDVFCVPFELPSRAELLEIIEGIAHSVNQKLDGNRDAIVNAASGLTTIECGDAAAYAYCTQGYIDPATIAKIKAETIKKGGILEVVDENLHLSDIGGYGALKAELEAKRLMFTREAKEYGLPPLKPMLFVGQPGSGKGLFSRATKTVFNQPQLRLEAGRLFGSYVGQTEGNWRACHAIARAIKPVIVHIDEIDGLIAGAESSGKTDGGTTARLVKTVLQDIQENSDDILFIFTANDIDGLPDPFIDRCEVWSFELPNELERRDIWSVHITKRGREPKKFSLDVLSEQSDGFSGRQIEMAWISAMRNAFNDNKREPRDQDCFLVLSKMVPIAVTMKDKIEARRARLAKCARPASDPMPEKKTPGGLGRKLTSAFEKPVA